MKKILMAVLVSLVAFTACENYGDDNHKFDNVVYLDVASTSDAQLTTFSNTRATYDCALQAVLTYPAGQDVAVTLTVDPSLVGTYNARYGTEWTMLDSKYYSLLSETVTIPAGRRPPMLSRCASVNSPEKEMSRPELCQSTKPIWFQYASVAHRSMCCTAPTWLTTSSNAPRPSPSRHNLRTTGSSSRPSISIPKAARIGTACGL